MIFHLKTRDHGTHWYNEISIPPLDSSRTLHASMYNWSSSPITTWRWPTYRAETCRCCNPPCNNRGKYSYIVVFDCSIDTPSSLPLYKTQRGWQTSESYTTVLFPREERARREADHSPLSSTEVKNERWRPPFPHTSSWHGQWFHCYRQTIKLRTIINCLEPG